MIRQTISISNEEALRQVVARIRGVPDFPKPGILFRDITPVLADPVTLALAVELHLEHIRDIAGSIDRVCGIESRGFLFGMAMACALGVGFAPIRKPGKLPAAVVEQSYTLEYGQDRLQLHVDAISAGDRVLIVDDLLATGGTAEAATKLVERLDGKVAACLFLIELADLKGRTRLPGHRVESLVTY